MTLLSPLEGVSSVVEASQPDAISTSAPPLGGERPEERAPSTPGNIETVVLEYYGDVYRYAFRLSGNGEDAADLAQQTYLLAGRRIHQLREFDRCRSWLLAIVRTCFLKSIQRRRPSLATDIELEVKQVAGAESADGVDREEMARALQELAETDRTILLMYYFEELSYKDIAAQLDIPMGTVMSRLSRAKQRLRQWFDSRDGS